MLWVYFLSMPACSKIELELAQINHVCSSIGAVNSKELDDEVGSNFPRSGRAKCRHAG